MQFPCLVIGATTPISGVLYGAEISCTGVPVEIGFDTVCIFQEGNQQRAYKKDETETVLNAEAYIPGNICPDMPNITGGKCEIFGTEYEIATVARKRNPDGSINFTRVGLK